VATKKSVMAKKMVISIHIENGVYQDVAGIPAGVGVVVTEIRGGMVIAEKFLDKSDNVQ
jgi:hypothetical protein